MCPVCALKSALESESHATSSELRFEDKATLDARADLWREERGKAKKLASAVVGDFYRRSNRPTYSRKSSSASGVVWATRATDHHSGFLVSGTSDFGF